MYNDKGPNEHEMIACVMNFVKFLYALYPK